MPLPHAHLGAGLFFKGASPRLVSVAAFVATQVVIDLESLVNMVRDTWPVHRLLHTVPGAVAAGLIAAGLVSVTARGLLPAGWRQRWPALAADLHVAALVGGALTGGGSHVLLDAIVHSDVQPLWPFSTHNPLYWLVASDRLHWSCVLAGAAGVVALAARWSLQSRAASRSSR